jgi:hypothetical protein
MDQAPVVSDRQVDGGERLIRALVSQGFPLVGACWAKTPRYSKPYLYLVTGRVQGVDARPSYQKVQAAFDDLESQWGHWREKLDPFDVMLVAPTDSIAKALEAEYLHGQSPAPALQTELLGGIVPLEGAALIYPQSLFTQPAPAAAG